LDIPIRETGTASSRNVSEKGMSKKARTGIAVLGTVAHFLPILSRMNPVGRIIKSCNRKGVHPMENFAGADP